MQWKDLEKDQNGYYFNVWVAKKSGNRDSRPIRIIFSEPYFAKWLENYPGERTDDNYVFSDLNDASKSMSSWAVTHLFRRLRERLNVKRFSAYVLRHFALDRMSKDPGMPSAVLRVLAGHSKNSTILSEYQHIRGDDLLNAQLSRAGKDIIFENNYSPQKKPVECPHCGRSNSYDAEMCGFCRFSLSQRTQVKMAESQEYDERMVALEKSNNDLIQLTEKLTQRVIDR